MTFAGLVVLILEENMVLIFAPSPIISLIICSPRGVLKEFSLLPSPYLDEETGKDASKTLPWYRYSLCWEISITILLSFASTL